MISHFHDCRYQKGSKNKLWNQQKMNHFVFYFAHLWDHLEGNFDIQNKNISSDFFVWLSKYFCIRKFLDVYWRFLGKQQEKHVAETSLCHFKVQTCFRKLPKIFSSYMLHRFCKDIKDSSINSIYVNWPNFYLFTDIKIIFFYFLNIT